jgi:hypothetical protein
MRRFARLRQTSQRSVLTTPENQRAIRMEIPSFVVEMNAAKAGLLALTRIGTE